MQPRVERRYTTFADYPRYEYILRVVGNLQQNLQLLDSLYLGQTLDEAKASIEELNNNRKIMGLSPIEVKF